MKVRTLATTVRCDARDAAMAHYLLVSQGNKPTSMSDLFRECVALVADLAVHKDLAPRIEDTSWAVKYLQENGVVDCLDDSRPNRASLLKILSEEDHREPVQKVLSAPNAVEILKSVKERLQREREEQQVLRGFTPKEVIDE